ncbi:MAG TPA: hypothetical protein VGL40_11505 [Bacillota bacterium]|jgi:dolichol kinase
MRWAGSRDRRSRILGGILLFLGGVLILASLPAWFWIVLCGVALAWLGWYVFQG